jgi:hypothetical protein
VFDRAQLIEGAPGIIRQQLAEHARNRLERQRPRRQLYRPRRGHHVRALADVHDERIAIGTGNRG